MAASSDADQVVIFKAPSDAEKDDVYRDILLQNGFKVINVPVLDFEFVNLDKLLVKLKNSANYSGIIFSSPRCVKACKLSVESSDAILKKWTSLRNYAVGEMTAKLAEEIGISTIGKESGNANVLADMISKGNISSLSLVECYVFLLSLHSVQRSMTSKGVYEKPFLYPIGSYTNNTFKLKLKESHIETDDIIIYKTIAHPQLQANLSDLLSKVDYPVYFLYFSPSGVNFTLPILKELQFNLEHVKFVAIGPTTEKSLKDHGLQVYSVVSKPTPFATLEALTSTQSM